jgi:hypothetical protein
VGKKTVALKSSTMSFFWTTLSILMVQLEWCILFEPQLTSILDVFSAWVIEDIVVAFSRNTKPIWKK